MSLSIAAFLTLAMQCAPTIHPDTAQDVARVESGFNPYAIGVVGQKGIFPDHLNDALTQADQLKAKGKNFSVGLMQINQSNFKRYGVTPKQLFDPCTNLSVFEKILTDCYQRGGSLKRALSCYYSGNFTKGQKAEKDFRQTSYVQRIGKTPPKGGYAVPSTKSGRLEKPLVSSVSPSLTPAPNYRSWDVLRQYPRYGEEFVKNKPHTQSENKEKEKNVESIPRKIPKNAGGY
ncbi:MAG: lytic transglycosylase domain-containing protein [Candidatus Hamiltonella defensa (Ceratovacuna japonica)]